MECKINVFSSRACELGTKSCIIRHYPLGCNCGWSGEYEDLQIISTESQDYTSLVCPKCSINIDRINKFKVGPQ